MGFSGTTKYTYDGNFNTSHVSVRCVGAPEYAANRQRFQYISCVGSIFALLNLFFTSAFQYISCVGSICSASFLNLFVNFISIHLMCRFDKLKMFLIRANGYFNTSHVSVRSIFVRHEHLKRLDFNTSHVSVRYFKVNTIIDASPISIHLMCRFDRSHRWSCQPVASISIHLMCRFDPSTLCTIEFRFTFQYISCVGSIVLSMSINVESS